MWGNRLGVGLDSPSLCKMQNSIVLQVYVGNLGKYGQEKWYND